MRLLHAAAALVLVGILAASEMAAAQVIPDDEALELSETLRDAFEQQGICYGWSLIVNDAGVVKRSDGSNLGPTTPVGAGLGCQRAVIFEADVKWTSEYSEAEDSSTYRVNARGFGKNPSQTTSASAAGIKVADLRVNHSNLANNPEDEVQTATLQLPNLVAASGLAPAVQLEANTVPLAAGDAPSDRPGSDWLRSNGGTLALFLIGFLLTACYAIYALLRWRRERADAHSEDHQHSEEETNDHY